MMHWVPPLRSRKTQQVDENAVSYFQIIKSLLVLTLSIKSIYRVHLGEKPLICSQFRALAWKAFISGVLFNDR